MQTGFELGGAQLDWPIGSAPGLTNHPDIEGVAARFDTLTSSGLCFVPLGSWKLGEPNGGNGFVWTGKGWEHVNTDEYLDLETGAGYNAKGLPGPGTDVGMERLPDLIDLARSKGVETGISFSPHTQEPLKELAEFRELGRRALDAGVLYVEVNLSCPNVPNRPPFYQDPESVQAFYDMFKLDEPLLNHFGRPGIYPKYGPRTDDNYVDVSPSSSIGGQVTSNTFGNQEPKSPDGKPAISVNGGKAGMSGPALNWLGEEQLQLARENEHPSQEIISVLGVSTGADVKRRLEMGATAVQLGSVLYWPELVGCETPAQVVSQIKRQFVEEMGS